MVRPRTADPEEYQRVPPSSSVITARISRRCITCATLRHVARLQRASTAWMERARAYTPPTTHARTRARFACDQTHTHTHTHTHLHTHTQTHTHNQKLKHAQELKHNRTQTHAHTHARARPRMHARARACTRAFAANARRTPLGRTQTGKQRGAFVHCGGHAVVTRRSRGQSRLAPLEPPRLRGSVGPRLARRWEQ